VRKQIKTGLKILTIILWGLTTPALALELAPEGAAELVPVETLRSLIESFRTFSTLLIILLAIAMVVIIYLIFALKSAQNQLQSVIDLIKQIDLMKEAVARIAYQVRKANFGDKQEGDLDEFEVIKKGF
jgi:hypothetical protein